MTVVLVEDHDDLREEMVAYLQRPGWRVLGVDSGEALNAVMAEYRVDVLILDVNLPYEDGYSIAERVRRTHPDLGIVMLTARTRPSDRSAGYRVGCDVYLTKPTNVVELEAVITNLLRRVQRPSPEPSYLLLLHAQQLRGPDGHIWDLTQRETHLLEILALAPKQELDADRIIYALNTKSHTRITQANLAVFISRLRQKLHHCVKYKNPIPPQRGKGYRLSLPLTILPKNN